MISKTPNQRHIYDSRQRAARDRAWEVQAARREGLATGQRIGLEEGLEEGLEKGLEKGEQIGQIRLLEQLLNERPTVDELLASMTLSELNERASILKDRLTRRGNS